MIGRRAKLGAIALVLGVSAAAHAAAAQSACGCAPPPSWRQLAGKPGKPNAELRACLQEKAYQARSVYVPLESKVAGLIAQCEVDVDQFEGAMVFGGGAGSEGERQAVEKRARDEAKAAVASYRGCGD